MRSRKKLKTSPKDATAEAAVEVSTDDASLPALKSSSSSSRALPVSSPISSTAHTADPIMKDEPRADEDGACISYSHPISRETSTLFAEAWSQTKCGSCTKTYRSPVTSKCGHSMCRLCFQEEVHRRSACPVCRAPLRLADFIPNISLDNLVQDLIDLKTYLDSHYSSTAAISNAAAATTATTGVSGEHPSQSPVVAEAAAATVNEDGGTARVNSAIESDRIYRSPIDDEMPPSSTALVHTHAVGSVTAQPCDIASLSGTKHSASPKSQFLSRTISSPPMSASQLLLLAGEVPLSAALEQPRECQIIKTQSPDASALLSAPPTTLVPVISSTYPDYFPVDDDGASSASESYSDDNLDDGGVDLKRENGAVDSEMVVWSQRDDAEGRLASFDRNKVIDQREAEWEESELYIEQCLSQAAAVDVKEAETAYLDGDQTTQIPLPNDQSLSAKFNGCSEQGVSVSSAQSMDFHEVNTRFEPGEFTLSPEIEFVPPNAPALSVIRDSDVENSAPIYDLPDRSVSSTSNECIQGGLVVASPPNRTMSYESEGPSRLNFVDTRGPSIGTLESFTPGYTLDPWAAEIHRELKKLKSAIQNNETQEYVMESHPLENTNETNLEKVLPNETEAPEENTFVGDALIKPVGADMLGEQYSPNNMITKAPNKPSIRVAAENLSPESETCLEKCINLEMFDYGDLSLFSDDQTNIFVVDCKKEAGLRLCVRSIMYIKAICVGVLIVDAQWLSDCATSGRVLPPEEYEINGSSEDSVSGGPYKSRVAARDTNGRMDLFAGVVFICDLLDRDNNITMQATDSSSAEPVSLSEIAWIVYFCGGDVMKKSEAKELLQENKIAILRPQMIYFRLYFDPATRSAAKATSSLGPVPIAARSVSWLLNVVCTHSFDRSKYLK